MLRRRNMLEQSYLLFLLASVAVILIPGQDLVLVMTRGLSQGSKAGLVTAAGVSVGLMGHTAIVSLGLGSILLASAHAFLLLKLIGAAYLIYLGVRLLREKELPDAEEARATTATQLFFQGAVSNISNPKITIFYIAYLPQFLQAGTESPSLGLFVLGTTFALLTFAIKAPVGWFAGFTTNWVRARPRVIRGVYICGGLTLLGLGVKLATESR